MEIKLPLNGRPLAASIDADTLLIDPTGDTSRAQAASIMRNFDLNVAE